MRNGSGTSFVNVPVLTDNGVITKKYLHDLEAAIKQRTPIAGDNITIKATDGSYVISTANGGINIGGTGGFREITLTVCSNGMPDKITVLGK